MRGLDLFSLKSVKLKNDHSQHNSSHTEWMNQTLTQFLSDRHQLYHTSGAADLRAPQDEKSGRPLLQVGSPSPTVCLPQGDAEPAAAWSEGGAWCKQ